MSDPTPRDGRALLRERIAGALALHQYPDDAERTRRWRRSGPSELTGLYYARADTVIERAGLDVLLDVARAGADADDAYRLAVSIDSPRVQRAMARLSCALDRLAAGLAKPVRVRLVPVEEAP